MVITCDPNEPSTSSDLLPRARAGDADAFCLLIEPLQAAHIAASRHAFGDPSAAEDLFQRRSRGVVQISRDTTKAADSRPALFHSASSPPKVHATARAVPCHCRGCHFFKLTTWIGKIWIGLHGAVSSGNDDDKNEAFAKVRHCIEHCRKTPAGGMAAVF